MVSNKAGATLWRIAWRCLVAGAAEDLLRIACNLEPRSVVLCPEQLATTNSIYRNTPSNKSTRDQHLAAAVLRSQYGGECE